MIKPLRTGAALICAVMFVGVGGRAAELVDPVDAGFFYSHDLTLEGAERKTAAGPFYEHLVYPNGNSLYAFRPFYSRMEEPGRNWVRQDYLWPVAMRKHFEDEVYWRFLLIFGHDLGGEDDVRSRVWAFPFLMWGQNADAERYVAFWPIGGKLYEFLGQDEVHFVLWPLYTRSRINDLQRTEILWPFISWTEGGPGKRYRFLPFYGYREDPDQFVKRTIMWPFFSSVRYTGEGVNGSGWVLFPIYGQVKLDNQTTYMVIPPLIRWSVHEDKTVGYFPWPFIQYQSGEVNRLVVWPFYLHKDSDALDRTWVLWPLFLKEDVMRKDELVQRRYAMPFYFREKRWEVDEQGEPTALSGKSLRLWPLYASAEAKGVRDMRVLELWPFRRVNAVENNLSPYWSVYTLKETEKGVERSAFWGLWRHRRDAPDAVRSSLFPLYERERAGDARSWSLLKGLVG